MPIAKVATRTTLAIAVWATAIAVSFAWGAWLTQHGHWQHVHTPPLYGRYMPRLGRYALPAIAVAILGTWAYPAAAKRLAWKPLLVVAAIAAGAWGAALASVDAIPGLLDSVLSVMDYRHAVGAVGSPHRFLAGFAHNIERYPIHVHGHPPGMVLVLWMLRRLGMGVPQWEVALCLVGFAACVPAVLIAMRDITGEAPARAAAPFLMLAPFAALGAAMTADALYAALVAWAIAFIVLATSRSGLRSDLYALSGGLLFGLAMYGTYGIVLLTIIPLAVAYQRRRFRPIVIAAVGPAIITAIFLAYGFWYVAGLHATWAAIAPGARKFRSPLYFGYSNLAIAALVLGPATAIGISRLRDRATWLLVGGATVALLLADLSQFSRAEVERIWLPFFVWIVLACSCIDRGRWSPRVWLGANAATALILAVTIRSVW